MLLLPPYSSLRRDALVPAAPAAVLVDDEPDIVDDPPTPVVCELPPVACCEPLVLLPLRPLVPLAA